MLAAGALRLLCSQRSPHRLPHKCCACLGCLLQPPCRCRCRLLHSLQVSVVSFKKGGLAVRCHAWDRNLGGRDIDELLFDHFCKEFQEKHKLDVKSNAKASFKLRLQCQRIKKVGGSVLLCGGGVGGWA